MSIRIGLCRDSVKLAFETSRTDILVPQSIVEIRVSEPLYIYRYSFMHRLYFISKPPISFHIQRFLRHILTSLSKVPR